MPYRRLLFHTRFRDEALNSLRAVLDLQAAGLEEVVLAHVVPRDEVAFVPFGGYLSEEAERLKEAAHAQFEAWRPEIEARGLRCNIRVEIGIVNAKILEIADDEGVDLIAAGPKKRNPAELIYVGTHVLDLLRRSPLPVLWAKHLVEHEVDGRVVTRVNDHFWERPLLATDWSPPSAKALAAVGALKGAATSAIVAHVIDEKLTKGREPAAVRRGRGRNPPAPGGVLPRAAGPGARRRTAAGLRQIGSRGDPPLARAPCHDDRPGEDREGLVSAVLSRRRIPPHRRSLGAARHGGAIGGCLNAQNELNCLKWLVGEALSSGLPRRERRSGLIGIVNKYRA